MPELCDLNFRSRTAGGGIDAIRPWLDEIKLRQRPHLIVLIHGFNNTRDEAEAAYAAFAELQQGLVPEGSDWAPGATVVRVFWPGDASWGLVSPAYYPWAVTRAQDTAATFAAMLEDLGRYAPCRLVVDFVAHSLGNRVLLRALSLLSASANIWVRRVVHMAAAVPTWKLDDSADPDNLLRGIAIESGADSHARSLFSTGDRVLSYAFPLGETVSPAHDGLFPVALGHEYWSEVSFKPTFRQEEAIGAGHSDYWGGDHKTPDTLRSWVARTVQRQLALGAGAIRATPLARLRCVAPIEARTVARRDTPVRQAGQNGDP
jgi:hypothetical protein